MIRYLLPRIAFSFAVFFVAGLTVFELTSSDVWAWIAAVPAGGLAFVLAISR